MTGRVQAAWTDNLLSVPEDSTEPAYVSDVYYQLQPGLLATYAAGRMVFQASYQLEANLYQKRDDAGSLQHLVGLEGFFLTSPRTELTTAVRLQTGELSAFATRTVAADGTFLLSPSGTSTYTSAEVNEILNFTATRELRLTENLRYRHFSTRDEASPVHTVGTGDDLALSLGADRSFRYSAVALMAGASLTTMGGSTDDNPDTGTTRQLTSNLVASWRRDFGPRWTVMLDGGVTAVIPFGGAGPSLQPTVGAQVGYFPLWGAAGLAVRRSVAPNLMVRQNTISDSFNLFASLPLPWLSKDPAQPRFSLSASLGLGRTQLLGLDDGRATGQYDVVGGDLSLDYHVLEGSVLSLRYQYISQMVGEVADVEDTTPALFDYVRNTVLISFSGRFPYRLAAEVPQRETMRVDRSNATPVGEEIAPAATPGAAPR